MRPLVGNGMSHASKAIMDIERIINNSKTKKAQRLWGRHGRKEVPDEVLRVLLAHVTDFSRRLRIAVPLFMTQLTRW